MSEQNNDLIAGRNAVSEALRSQRSINKILLQEGAHGGSLGEIIALAKQKGVPVETVKAEKLDKLAKGLRHQGVAALAAPIAFRTLDDVFVRAAEKMKSLLFCFWMSCRIRRTWARLSAVLMQQVYMVC